MEFVYHVLTERPCSSVSEVLLAKKPTAGEARGARHSDAISQGVASLWVGPLACRRLPGVHAFIVLRTRLHMSRKNRLRHLQEYHVIPP